MQILYAEKVETQENCVENLQSVAFSSMWIFSAGSDNGVLEYMIKCRLFTQKWHVMKQSLIWQNGIWLMEYSSTTWKITLCSCSALIWCVFIRLWTLFLLYVMEWKLFGMWVKAIWLVQDTYSDATSWLVQATYHPTC